MKQGLAVLIAIVLCAAIRVSVAQDAGHAAGLVSSWTLLALERLEAGSEPARIRGARGLLVLDGAGNVFEYFNARNADASEAAETSAQRAFAEHGGFWGRYEADAAKGVKSRTTCSAGCRPGRARSCAVQRHSKATSSS